MAELAYKVEDRSILLPYYRRLIVDPLVPLLPASLSPNTITHVGHVANLIGMVTLLALRPERGWPFFFAALTLNFYTWCDNADGAHARRTKQCSPFGEFLDHGLDQFNTVYMAVLTAFALGASPMAWVALVLVIPGGAVLTFWEQSNTGVLRLGLLNQIEAMLVLTVALVLAGLFGTNFFTLSIVPGFTLRDFLVLWPAATLMFGMARNMVRVAAQCGVKATAPALVYLLFAAAVFGAIVVGALTLVFAATLAASLNVHLGMRMLARRLKKEQPAIEPLVAVGAVLVTALVAMQAASRPLAPSVAQGLVALMCAMMGLQVAADARTGVTLLARADQAA